jgi:hypothetical protein
MPHIASPGLAGSLAAGELVVVDAKGELSG